MKFKQRNWVFLFIYYYYYYYSINVQNPRFSLARNVVFSLVDFNDLI